MRKLFTLICCFGLISSVAMAKETKKKKKPLIHEMNQGISGQGYGMAGCGLGSIVFGQEKGMIQIVAATLNGTGYQTFGISTGTSNCKIESGKTAKNTELFIEVNREALAKDISRGSGESIQTLANIVGCKKTDGLGAELQKNYDTIFPAKAANSAESRKAIFDVIKANNDLSKDCANVG